MMPNRIEIVVSRSAAKLWLVAAALVLSVGVAAAQTAQPQIVPPPEPEPQAAPSRENTGLVQEIRRLFDLGTSAITSPFGDTKNQIDEINRNAAATGKNIGDAAVEVGKTAAGAVVAPLTTRVVSGQERCAVAPNGAPDCNAAAISLCKRNGYTAGKSIDFTSAEQCSPSVYLSGWQHAPVCTTVTFISRAVCQ